MRILTSQLKCGTRSHQLIRQHNWALFTFLVLLEQLSWPKNSTISNRCKFYRFDNQTIELQESLICLLDDFGVTQHLLIELIEKKDDKENMRGNTGDRAPIRCTTLLEHNLKKISAQLWNIFSQVNMKTKLDVSR